jgi:hypothetical protein
MLLSAANCSADYSMYVEVQFCALLAGLHQILLKLNQTVCNLSLA